jgi:hypothetical protein
VSDDRREQERETARRKRLQDYLARRERARELAQVTCRKLRVRIVTGTEFLENKTAPQTARQLELFR